MTTGVLVMAYGTPATPDDVAAYYTRIRHGRPPSDEQLADLVRRYHAIGGTSPLAQRTAAQVDGLRRVLDDVAPDTFSVHFGSKYAPPLIEDAARDLRNEGVDHVIGLVLAPHESSLSTRQYFERAAAALEPDVRFSPVGPWWDRAAFLRLIAERVNDALRLIPEQRHATTEVIFSAHSLPQRVVDEGDNYPEQLYETARRAAAVAGVTQWDTAWQSAGRTSEPWLGPDILDVLRTKRAAGVTDVVSCPVGFVSDHLEVLFDLDIEAKTVADQLGLNFVRTPSLNDDPALLSLWADLVRERA